MAEGHWQLGDGVDFPFGTAGVGGWPPLGEGRGQEGKSRHGAKGESDFLKMWGHYIKNQNRGAPQAVCEPGCPAPHWSGSARGCPGSLQANAWDALLWRVGYPVEPSSQLY